ncbi:MAG: hypothetical protein HY013_09965 [Candidatus Solibacter usitatus]|nr:hypothetical protein [Candidatus Solibacter usitatus]
MSLLFKSSILASIVLWSAPLTAAGKDAPFKAGPAAGYSSKQTNEGVTIAAVPFDTEERAREAFGKLNPNRYGVLPVLVVIRNGGSDVLRLEDLRVEYMTPSRSKIEATPARDVPYLSAPNRPRPIPGPTGGMKIGRSKNPLANPVIDVRAFSARMLPKGEEASGFFYFQTGHRHGSQVYVAGIRLAGSGKELFYFEIRME